GSRRSRPWARARRQGPGSPRAWVPAADLAADSAAGTGSVPARSSLLLLGLPRGRSGVRGLDRHGDLHRLGALHEPGVLLAPTAPGEVAQELLHLAAQALAGLGQEQLPLGRARRLGAARRARQERQVRVVLEGRLHAPHALAEPLARALGDRD